MADGVFHSVPEDAHVRAARTPDSSTSPESIIATGLRNNRRAGNENDYLCYSGLLVSWFPAH